MAEPSEQPTSGLPSCPDCGAALAAAGAPCPACAQDPALNATVLHDAEATVGPEHTPTVADVTPRDSPSELKQIAHYRIVRELGAGGMGTVYLAHDEKMKRNVALKVLARHRGDAERAGKRFEQEAWIAGRLDHPNLVKVYEQGYWQELSYFSMEVVDGGSLGDVLDNVRRTGGDPDRKLEFGSSKYVHWAIRKVIEAARGLDFAHRQGVVHRDIKPMNLLLSREPETVKIADFGLAIDADVTRMTTAGTVMGTISFMAPEQIRGQQDRIDARTDVYALGVTLFELLTLEMPYTGKSQQVYMSQVLTTEARRASKLNAKVSRDLEVVLRKAMEKRRADRYQTAAAFAEDLDSVLHLRPISARPTGRFKLAVKWAQRKPVHAALAATLALTVPTLAFVGVRAVQARTAGRQERIEELLREARWLEERWEERSGFVDVLDRAETVLDLDRDNAMALRARAIARFMLSGKAETEQLRSAMRDSALDDLARIAEQRPTAAWPHALRSFMLHEIGRTADARASEARAEKLRSDPPSDEDLSEAARLASVRQQYDTAAELFSEVIRRHPDRVRAIMARAYAYEELGFAEEAFVDYRVAVGLQPDGKFALVDLARMSVDRGALDDARLYLERVLESDPDDEYANENLSSLLMAEGRQAVAQGERDRARSSFEQASDAARRALGRNDELLWPELNLAASLVERNRLAEESDPALLAQAIEHYGNVLGRWDAPPLREQDRQVYAAALLNGCDAQIELRRLQEALTTCAQVTELFPENAVAHYNLAGVFALLGRQEDSLAALERDLEFGDTDWAYLATDDWFNSLRGNPRFEAILAEMKRRAES